MPLQKVGPNLITQGNAGTFENDPSTWGGIPAETYALHARTSVEKFSGAHSLQVTNIEVAASPPSQAFTLVRFNASVVSGKNYVVDGKIKASSSQAPGSDTAGYAIRIAAGATLITDYKVTVANAKSGFQSIQYQFTADSTGTVVIEFLFAYHSAYGLGGSPNDFGLSFIDDVSCYEFEDPVPTCDLHVSAALSTVTDETEIGAGDGTITVSATSSNGPIQYSNNNGSTWQNGNFFSGLDPGTYYIVARDALGCVYGPVALTVEASATPPTCDIAIDVGASTIVDESTPGADDGQITVVATSSNGPIEYSKDNGSNYQASNVFSGLADGDYQIKVKDDSACEAGPVTMTVLAGSVTCDAAITNVSETDPTTIGGTNGSLTITATSTAGSLEYSIDDGDNWQSSNSFTGLSKGTYPIRIRDANNCQDTDTATLSDPPCTLSIDSISHVNESYEGFDDGSITVNASTSNGPLEYSKDNGSNWQSSNVFGNLADGSYPIVVRDAIGCELSQFVLIEPGLALFAAIYFDKNPIVFTRPQSGNSTEDYYRIRNEVRIESVIDSETFDDTIMKSELEPDQDGKCEFYVQRAFRGIFDPSPPQLGQSQITRLTDRIRVYRNYYGDVYDQLADPSSYGESDRFLCLFGGLSREAFADLADFFTDYLPTHKKFMSWQPTTKTVHFDQEEYLNFFVYDLYIRTVTLKIKAYYDDDTTQETTTKSNPSVLYGHLLSVPLGPTESGALGIDTGKNLVKYDAWLIDQDQNVISEVRTYVIDLYKKPSTRYFMFLGSLGSFETIRATGLGKRMASFDREIVQKHISADYSSSDSQFEVMNPSKQIDHEFSTGFVSKDEADYFQDMLLTTQFYDITSGKRVPLRILTDSAPIATDRDNKYYVRFKCKGGYVNESYTPEDA